MNKNRFFCEKIFAIVAIIFLPIVQGTLEIISDDTTETVFSVEETSVDTTSGFGLEGRLVISSPLDACEAVLHPPTPSQLLPPPHKWILITTVDTLENDSCSLSRKAKNAESAGYSGIIMKHVGSNDTGGMVPKFGLDWIGVNIYACVVGDEVGSFLIENYPFPKRYYVKFKNEPYYPIGLLANFVIVSFLGLVTILLLMRLFYYLYFNVTRSVVQRRRRRKNLLSESQLRKLPILKWTSSIPQDTCSICLDQFVIEEEIRVLPCSHVFHKVCIDPWLLKESRKCPNCKGRVLFPNERYSYSSDESRESDSGDERTPLLRPSHRHQENYRFIETLTESHNSRALLYPHDQQQHDDETPSTSSSLQNGNTKPKSTPSVPKVTFAPTNPRENVNAISSKAFVLPGTNIIKSRGGNAVRKPNLMIADVKGSSSKSFTPNVPSIINNDFNDVLSTSGSSSGSEKTLLEFHDVPNTGSSSNSFSLSDSVEVKSISSFHSCQSFNESYEADNASHKELFQSFSSHNS